MKVVIESKYLVRGKPITSYHSFPRFSEKIEETMCSLLSFLKNYEDFSLVMKVTHGHC